MNVLDENVPDPQRTRLRRWRVPVYHIGYDLGAGGTSDDDLIRVLRGLRRPTFFTLDADFCRRELAHERYCLVWLNVRAIDAAAYIRRLLNHPELDTQAKRMGAVVEVSPSGVTVWRRHAQEPAQFPWPRRRRK